jgi:hypothetical protein
MARKAGKVFLTSAKSLEQACRLFEEEDLRPEERAFVSLLNLGLIRSLQANTNRSLLGVPLPRAGRREDTAKRDMCSEEEGNSPEDLLT